MSSLQLPEAWSDRFEFTLATPRREIYDNLTRFTKGDYLCLSCTWGDCTRDPATIFLGSVATTVNMLLKKALRDIRDSFPCRLDMKG